MTDAPIESDDATLLARHRDGDPDAFAILFARHRDRLWAVALRTAGNPQDAEDALQDALVSAFRRADSFRGEAAVTTWLHRIVVNACLDLRRRQKVRHTEPLPDDPDSHDRADTATDRTTGSDPVGQVLAGEQRARIRTALQQLPPEQRATIVLVDMEGYSLEEVAQILDCPVGTVKSRASRGRARLLELLGGSTGGTTGRPDASKTTYAQPVDGGGGGQS